MSTPSPGFSRTKHLKPRLLLATVSVLLTVLLVEGSLRLFVGPAPLPEPPFRAVADSSDRETEDHRRAARRQFHPYRGWSEAPMAHWPERVEKPWRNLFGFASTIRDYRELNRDDFVIGIFGGSVALHLATRANETIVETLTAARPELAGRIRIVTAAEGGFKQPQQLATLSELLILGVPLDIAVNLDGYNDAALAMENAMKGVHPVLPHYTHMEGLVRLSSRIPSEADLLAAAAIISLRQQAEARRRWLEASSVAWFYLVRAWGVRDLQRLQGEATQREIEFAENRGGSELLFQLPDDCLDKPATCERLVARIWSSSSRSMDAISRRAGVRYMHFLQPNQHLKGTKPLSAEERERFYDPGRIWNRGYQSLAPRLRRHGQHLANEGVDFVDLTGVFREHNETLYVDSCCHLNQLGNDLMAVAIGRHIASRLDEGRED